MTGHVLGNYHKTEIEPLTDLLGAMPAEANSLRRATTCGSRTIWRCSCNREADRRDAADRAAAVALAKAATLTRPWNGRTPTSTAVGHDAATILLAEAWTRDCRHDHGRLRRSPRLGLLSGRRPDRRGSGIAARPARCRLRLAAVAGLSEGGIDGSGWKSRRRAMSASTGICSRCASLPAGLIKG